jgi:sugar (pentulose or hexulose) kinase
MSLPVIAIFDAGKTNKKVLLFDEEYKLRHEENIRLPETTDEDGFACEDIHALTRWVKNSFQQLRNNKAFDIKAVNYSAYGASLVYLDSGLNVFLPLYNYLKPYAPRLREQFYAAYGGEISVAKQTASPVLGSLNSGMQLYRLKYEKPDEFARIKYALHLPQYLSFILGSQLYADITSIGCHTHLWDFQRNDYHQWVNAEGIKTRVAPILDCKAIAGYADDTIPVGAGLHDSSAALIPYLATFHEPFVLLSTGTWCISLNPFNHIPLTDDELQQDCLCYLSYEGKPVKASRLFAGYEHEQQVKKLASHFNKSSDYFTIVSFDRQMLGRLKPALAARVDKDNGSAATASHFEERDLHAFASYEEAYHQLIADLVLQQIECSRLVLKGTAVKKLFVDGGFSQNPIYMHLLAAAFPNIQIYAASVAQASALGAALAIHQHWNSNPVPGDLIKLKRYV